ncbi:cell envelope integrity protein TolA [Thalassotalea sp. HSM 43]|uniref:cell envelope integrity protein TolA n=1 Tax=Thalassotalea sp. HSM 43 TaxID=2552945 RepID=UPI001081C0EA|nr:cell envelope integrity protein TolA [Thalassotalea sp. HSM 43]QBY05578.1 cell envelope integrity protein TolA [Thalassotalea sp. HSM 43]
MNVIKKMIANLVDRCMGIFTYLPDGKTIKQNYLIALGAAVVVHAVFAIILMANTDFSPKQKPTPKPQLQVIDAVVVDQSKLQQQVDKLKREQQRAKEREQKRIKDLERRADDARKKRQAEADRIKKLESDRKKKEVERKKAEDAARTAKAKAAAAEKARQKKVAERKQAEKAAADAKAKREREEEAARQAEAERRRKKAEQERKQKEAAERAEQERLLEQQMQEEMAARQSARSQQVMSEVDKYSALIVQSIERNFIQDEATMRGKSCKVRIKLASSGFVISASAVEGDRAVCQEAVKAVNKAGTLPVSKDPLVFEQLENIIITYAPEFN